MSDRKEKLDKFIGDKKAELGEKRAELERLLEESRRQKGEAPLSEVKKVGLNSHAAAWAPESPPPAEGGGGSTVYDYGDDADDGDEYYDPEFDGEDEDDVELDALEAELLRRGVIKSVENEIDELVGDATPVAAAAAAGPSAVAATSAPTKSTTSSSRVKGEFDILRLAKVGDFEEFRNVEAAEGPSVLLDNTHRDALHYAADSGNVALVKYLLTRPQYNAYRPDDLGFTPYDIALIGHHEECAEALFVAANGKLKKQSFGDVLEKFTPKPKGFALSKPLQDGPPKPKRAFWGAQAAASSVPAVTCTTVVPGGELPASDILALQDPASAQSFLDRWLRPHSKRQLIGLGNFACHVLAGASSSELVGSISLLPIGGLTVPGRPPHMSSLVGNWWIRKAEQKTGTSVALLRAVTDTLKSAQVASAFFRTSTVLPFQALATVKLFARCIAPHALFTSGNEAIRDVAFPDYDEYETILRCDFIAKSFLSLSGIDSSAWKAIGAEDDQVWESVANLLRTQLPKDAEIFTQLDGPSLKGLFSPTGLSSNVVVSASGVVTDFIVLRHRMAFIESSISASVLVFSCCTSILAEKRLYHISALAADRFSAQVVYCTNTCGITEKDLRMAAFEEVPGTAERVYLADSSSTSLVKALTPASKVFLPLHLL